MLGDNMEFSDLLKLEDFSSITKNEINDELLERILGFSMNEVFDNLKNVRVSEEDYEERRSIPGIMGACYAFSKYLWKLSEKEREIFYKMIKEYNRKNMIGKDDPTFFNFFHRF
jgi:hypothetical protein